MEVVEKRIYRHYKGDLYLVEGIAKGCETLKDVVLYRGLYEDCPLWVRALEDFTEEVNQNGQVHRFEAVSIESTRNK